MLELTEHRHAEAQTMNDLAAVHARNGSLRDAIACYERSLLALRERGDRHGEASTLASLASVYARDGRQADAIDCYESSLSIMREQCDPHGAARVLRDFTLAKREMQDVA